MASLSCSFALRYGIVKRTRHAGHLYGFGSLVPRRFTLHGTTLPSRSKEARMIKLHAVSTVLAADCAAALGILLQALLAKVNMGKEARSRA